MHLLKNLALLFLATFLLTVDSHASSCPQSLKLNLYGMDPIEAASTILKANINTRIEISVHKTLQKVFSIEDYKNLLKESLEKKTHAQILNDIVVSLVDKSSKILSQKHFQSILASELQSYLSVGDALAFELYIESEMRKVSPETIAKDVFRRAQNSINKVEDVESILSRQISDQFSLSVISKLNNVNTSFNKMAEELNRVFEKIERGITLKAEWNKFVTNKNSSVLNELFNESNGSLSRIIGPGLVFAVKDVLQKLIKTGTLNSANTVENVKILLRELMPLFPKS